MDEGGVMKSLPYPRGYWQFINWGWEGKFASEMQPLKGSPCFRRWSETDAQTGNTLGEPGWAKNKDNT